VEGDESLVKRFRAGDRLAFDELVRRHYRRAYNIAYRMLGDAEAAADATQAAFLRAYRGLLAYRQRAAFTTWLYRIVINVCLDAGRRLSHRKLLSLHTGAGNDDAPFEHRIAAPAASPEELLLRHERARAVQGVLLKLPPLYRAVLVLYELHGLPYQDIAQILGIPLGTVKSRLNRARAAFAREFAPYRELFDLPARQSNGTEGNEPGKKG
jgi:RNA polymerase sigma-70 factor (ECF subfamily)